MAVSYQLCILLFSLNLAFGCAGKNHASKRSENGNISLSGHEAVILEDQGLELTDSQMKGSGKFVFTRPVDKIATNQTFRIVITVEEGGYADFRAFAYARLSMGLSLRISKIDGQFQIEFGDGAVWDAPVALSVDGALPLNLTVDVDNSTTPALVAIFNGLNSMRRTADLIYKTPENPNPVRHGFGAYYGFVLANASLQSFEISQ